MIYSFKNHSPLLARPLFPCWPCLRGFFLARPLWGFLTGQTFMVSYWPDFQTDWILKKKSQNHCTLLVSKKSWNLGKWGTMKVWPARDHGGLAGQKESMKAWPKRTMRPAQKESMKTRSTSTLKAWPEREHEGWPAKTIEAWPESEHEGSDQYIGKYPPPLPLPERWKYQPMSFGGKKM